jgi:AraC-like DNA-binding protein
MPELLSESEVEPMAPGGGCAPGRSAIEAALPAILRGIRLADCLQFMVTLGGEWQINVPLDAAERLGAPRDAALFHIVLDGGCWFRSAGYSAELGAGDIIALPCGEGHRMGVGAAGRLIAPARDLPPRPWSSPPVLRYDQPGDARTVRLFCGFLRCDTISFAPLRTMLGNPLHVRTKAGGEGRWLQAAVAQIAAEMDVPCGGGAPMVERLTEIVFVEILRRRILSTGVGSGVWRAAVTDRALSKCLALIHDAPRRDWSVRDLAAHCGLSRSTLAERFEAILGTSPARYIREWRLSQARSALSTGARPICAIAQEAGYGTEAAFCRAFTRTYGVSPGAFRESARRTAA